MEQLTERITELLFETVSSGEQMILVYLEEHISDLPSQTLAQVADNNYCSTTSVTRLIKKLGYNSFKEMQLSLSLSNQIKSTGNLLNSDPMFIKCLESASCIYIYGKGASQITALYLFRKLIKLGYDVSHVGEQDLLYSLHNKTVLCISNSGETSTVYKVMSDIKELNNCTILSLTKSGSTLANISDVSITHDLSTYGQREEQKHLLEIANKITLDLKTKT